MKKLIVLIIAVAVLSIPFVFTTAQADDAGLGQACLSCVGK